MKFKIFDYIVVGGGIVGASTAYKLRIKFPKATVLVVEKEPQSSLHQTGRNSGVIHSGLYYTPGSLKAKTCINGYHQLLKFCYEESIDYEICGKLVVPKNELELKKLESIAKRGLENGLEGIRFVDRSEVKKMEPYILSTTALYVPQTGIVDYVGMTKRLIAIAVESKGSFRTNAKVVDMGTTSSKPFIRLSNDENVYSEKIIFCAGLQSDRLAKLDGLTEDIQIVPFRGDYYQLKNESRYKVKNLIYPVPNPDFPFLGVHFTRMIDGSAECGPNAVFSFSREGYNRTSFNLRDSWSSLSFEGTRRLFATNWRFGLKEYELAFLKNKYLAELRKIMPNLEASDLVRGRSGIRAQALDKKGNLVDDFVIKKGQIGIHVLNAPSPAATASLAIADEIISYL
ncbi:MAG: L-2-hydroxyglutarate oxidase LhgO [Owenweeksia sp. TMED14]|nr:MAG: L-2-hydroxyglutarate oxidase LhgO [Owenweeksia sp. TMED14]